MLANTKGVIRMIDWDSPEWGQKGHNVHVSAYGDLAGQEHGEPPSDNFVEASAGRDA